VFVLQCQYLRRKTLGDGMISTVTLSGQGYSQLCELVWIEGEPTTGKTFYDFERERRRAKSTQAEIREDELNREEEIVRQREDWAQIEADYEAEIRYNTERPDYD